jgi:hypothetical protein
MNIFAVNNNPVLAAFDLPDKLVVKMPTESLQLLTPWAFKVHQTHIQKPDGSNYGTKGFIHHHCAKWLYENPSNVCWLILHANALCMAYSVRYKKKHGARFGLNQIGLLFASEYTNVEHCDHTQFVQAMPDEFKIPDDPITAYRNYINGYKGYAEWNFSEKPTWWDEEMHQPIREKYLAEQQAKRMKRQNDKHSRVSSTV